jgi:hypothetical protein
MSSNLQLSCSGGHRRRHRLVDVDGDTRPDTITPTVRDNLGILLDEGRGEIQIVVGYLLSIKEGQPALLNNFEVNPLT